jgi:hypothetical protein
MFIDNCLRLLGGLDHLLGLVVFKIELVAKAAALWFR